ncbi:MAG: Crp/Fnr family transcriptional regulator [Saprospiraceae bacterium]
MEKLLRSRYEYVFEEKLINEIIREGQFRKVDKDVCMIDKGDKITHMPLVLEGAIKVVDEEKDGQEYLLYYLEMGDSCAMTMTCCLGGKRSEIRAITESNTLMYMIPIQRMEDWLIKYKSWRMFVLDSYNSRMKEMLETIDSLAFLNMEQRLYKYLKDRAMVLQSPTLEITHSRIANDLNTSRVVISRLMKKLILDNKIKTNRNEVTVLKFLPKD